MKPHAWEVEEFNAGPLGGVECWRCFECGANGGPVWYDFDSVECKPYPQWWDPCWYHKHQRLDLTQDCDDAKARIIEFKAKMEITDA